jgi:glycosyltransferase involved in cell wall biosynthesis
VLFENRPNDAVREAQRRCLALIAPSTLRAPFGMVTLETLAGGCPVIASRIGGLAEVVADGVSGIVVPPRDAALLTASIETFLSDSALRRRLADGAAASAARFHPNRVLARFEGATRRLSRLRTQATRMSL